MNIHTRKGRVEIILPTGTRRTGVVWFALCVLFVSCSASLTLGAQELPRQQSPDPSVVAVEEHEAMPVSLPDGQQMALALANPSQRNRALLDLATASNILFRAGSDISTDPAELAKQFLDDRAWLELLIDRYGWRRPHSAILDPAAWLVLEELQQHDLDNEIAFFPGQTTVPALLYHVFQRTGERLAAAHLPILLLEIEVDAITTWNAFLQLTGSDGVTDDAWKTAETTWSSNYDIPKPAVTEHGDGKLLLDDETFLVALSQLVSGAVTMGPPDNTGLVQLRYMLFTATPDPEGSEIKHARFGLYLASLIDGLHEGHYFEFARGLLSVTTRLLEGSTSVQASLPLVEWLVRELPAISAHYAQDFAGVDPRLNAVLVESYAVLRDLANPDDGSSGIRVSRAMLADAMAQLSLLIPDMGYYFDTPVRATIEQQINICLISAAGVDEEGIPTMTRQQFDGCMDVFLQLADHDTRLAELSGDMNGPFTSETLRRELSVTPWQRINYFIGYLHERYSSACPLPANALPNPLEWAVLATTMSWFAEHSPVYFNSPENEARLATMRNIGEQLILDLTEQTRCLAGSGADISDPVSRGVVNYELALRELNIGVKNAEVDFRTQRLNPGADVLLERDALQATSYRPDDLSIRPCDVDNVCEMSGDLSATRALIGLFPDEYLIAEQTAMGRIEICYRNMEWVQRRSELVRPDDENVANYYGYLGFDLIGRYVEDGQASEIFGFRFTSPREHHYLFAQSSDDVLNDSCPVEWIGTRVVTPLREGRKGVVPNRLTYLAASRTLPSRLLQNNWERGAEWRDWFVTGIGVSPLDTPPGPEIIPRLNQHLDSLYQAEQAEIYQRLLLPNARNAEGDDVSLFEEMSQVSIEKALIRQQMSLLYPQSLVNSDPIRAAMVGDNGLLEGRSLRRFREKSVALTSVNAIALERLDDLRETWSEQPEAIRRLGSVPASLLHALGRINTLYRAVFTSRPDPLQEIDVSVPQDAEN